jgi:hypothetical protein
MQRGRRAVAKFREEIMNIAREREKMREPEESMDSVEAIYGAKEAMDVFFSLADAGVSAYNEGSGKTVISTYGLSEELLTLFLNLPGKRLGFCIIGPERFVVFLDETPNGILVLGQKKQSAGAVGQILMKARQLIKITCLQSENGFIFKDNTGATLDQEDIMKHIINWVSE